MHREDFTTYSDDFRKHYVTAFGDRGTAYTDYEPAYRYGYELGTNERYRGRDWVALEADARRDWEARHPSTWERFKDAIRYSWDKVRADLELSKTGPGRATTLPGAAPHRRKGDGQSDCHRGLRDDCCQDAKAPVRDIQSKGETRKTSASFAAH
jgi:hypothetical protein